MAVKNFTGQPFVGYVALTNGAPAAAIPIYVIAGSGTAYTLLATERIMLAGVLIGTNDTATELVQITDQATTPKVLASVYVVNTQPPFGAPLPAGYVLGKFGTNLRAIAGAVTAAKTIEVTIYGSIITT